ncbi:MAG: hypothetical protein U0531_13700 [Dehalococcoidia bacterium]
MSFIDWLTDHPADFTVDERERLTDWFGRFQDHPVLDLLAINLNRECTRHDMEHDLLVTCSKRIADLLLSMPLASVTDPTTLLRDAAVGIRTDARCCCMGRDVASRGTGRLRRVITAGSFRRTYGPFLDVAWTPPDPAPTMSRLYAAHVARSSAGALPLTVGWLPSNDRVPSSPVWVSHDGAKGIDPARDPVWVLPDGNKRGDPNARPDDVRDLLGLRHVPEGHYLVMFEYPGGVLAAARNRLRAPTVLESVPENGMDAPDRQQWVFVKRTLVTATAPGPEWGRTANLSTSAPGADEAVHCPLVIDATNHAAITISVSERPTTEDAACDHAKICRHNPWL